MCHWKKWIWPGLITVGLLTLLAAWFRFDAIETDLQTKAAAALNDQGQSWASIEMSGRDATVTGVAPSEQSQSDAAGLADGVYDVRVAKSAATLLAAQSPYVLAATRDGNQVELTGFVPDESTRATIVDAAKAALPETEIKDSLALARGAPEGLVDAAGFGLAQLAGLDKGRMALEDTSLTVEGAASTQQTFGDINNALDGDLPGGAQLALKNITPPAVSPYTWSGKYNGQSLALSGYVPDEPTRESILAAAKGTLPDAQIDDQMQFAAGAPADFASATSFALNQLPRFSEGDVSLSDLDLTVNGLGKTPADYLEARRAVSGTLDHGVKLAASDIRPPSVDPYSWGADYNGQSVTLSGFVPDETVRTRINESVKSQLGDIAIVDNMQIAEGAPGAFPDATDFAIAQLPRFDRGMVSLSGTNFSVSGVAKSAGDYTSARDTVTGDLPAEMALASEAIKPPVVSPYVWNADYDGEKLILGGFAPDSDAREAVAREAAAMIPDADVVNEIEIAAGAPDNYGEKTAGALKFLTYFLNGKVSLEDSALSIEGAARSAATFDTSTAAAKGDLAGGATLAMSNITPPAVSPYTWAADYDGTTVRLTGHAPNDEARAAVEQAAKQQLPEATIVNELVIAEGAPEAFPSATSQALGFLPKFVSGKVALSDLALSVEGKAADSPGFIESTGMTKDLKDGATLALSNIEPPAAEGEYVWGAQKEGDAIVLTGYVPDEAARGSIAALAANRFPDAKIVDRTVIATGAPDGFADNAKQGINLLRRFDTGKASVTNTSMDVEGTALSVPQYEAAQKDVSSGLTGGFKYAAVNITPAAVSPYSWFLDNRGETAVLSGYVPNEAAREKIVADTGSALGKSVDDKMRIAAGEPDGFDTITTESIAGVATLDDGFARLNANGLLMRGRAQSQEQAAQIDEKYKAGVKSDVDVQTRITFPPAPKPAIKVEPEPKPAEEKQPEVAVVTKPAPEPAVRKCEIDFTALFRGDKVLFATDRAVIREESYPLLDRIAKATKQCPDTKFRVEGHTDSRGRAEYNRRLSKARAEAVVEYMVKAGVTAGMVAVGFGETNPVATNTTDEGRARNRRIEFEIIQN